MDKKTNDLRTYWRNLEEQHHSQKRMNWDSNMRGKSCTKVWRRKPECEQAKSNDSVHSRYFSVAEHLKEEDRANNTCSEHHSVEIIRKETETPDLLTEEELHEWAL